MRDERKDGSRARPPSAKRNSTRGESAKENSRRGESANATSTGGEFDFISHLRRQTLKRYGSVLNSGSSLIPHPSSLITAIGDDAAVVRSRAGHDTVVTADLLVEDIDFRRASAPPRLLGHKALAVSLSDLASMGARPRWALVSLGVPEEIWNSAFLKEFYEGFFALADAHGVALVGGDVSRTPERIVVDSIVLGEVARGRAILRAGALPGDRIYVTGTLGGAAAGLQFLEAGERLPSRSGDRAKQRGEHVKQRNEDATTSDEHAQARVGRRLFEQASSRASDSPRVRLAARRELMLRHLRPVPRLAWGERLGARRLASAAIDLSDGLSSDLSHLCRESGVGATIDASQLPFDASIARASLDDADALALALHGGEDFELLFTVRPRCVARLPAELEGVRVTCIGEVTAARGRIRLQGDGRTRILKPAGFQHFKPARG